MKKAALLALLFVLLGFNVACGFVFMKLELRREMRTARRERLDMGRISDVCSQLADPRDCTFLWSQINAAASVDYRCGKCANPEMRALEKSYKNKEAVDLSNFDYDKTAMRAAMKQICSRRWRHCKWEPVGAVYFAFTIYTTVGFGDFAPRTTCGRFFVVFVVLFGMGIAFAFFGALGEKIYINVQKHGLVERHKGKFFTALMTAYILGGGLYFHALGLLQASPSFGDAVYYCVVAISTLGLGDELPRVTYLPLLSTYVYTIGGIALASAAIQALAENWGDMIARSALAAKRRTLQAGRELGRLMSVVTPTQQGRPSPAPPAPPADAESNGAPPAPPADDSPPKHPPA